MPHIQRFSSALYRLSALEVEQVSARSLPRAMHPSHACADRQVFRCHARLDQYTSGLMPVLKLFAHHHSLYHTPFLDRARLPRHASHTRVQ